MIKLAWLGAPLVIVGEAGHLLLDWARQHLAHHLFHIVFGVGAGVIFLAWVIADIRRNGRPTFSWRLHPDGRRRPDRCT